MQPVTRKFNGGGGKVSRISWAAIFAGAITALAVAFLLNILGLGIGLSTIDPLSEANPLDGLGTGTAIWWGLSNFAALFIGGMVAARMSGLPSNVDGALHGFLAWALYSLVTVYFVTSSIGGIVNGIAGAASGLFGGDKSKQVTVQLNDAKQQAQDDTQTSYEGIKKQVFKAINAGERFNVLPEDAAAETRDFLQESKKDFQQLDLEDNLESFFNDVSFDIDDNGDLDVNVEGDKDFFDKVALKDYLTDNTELDDQEINGMIKKWEKNVQEVVTKAENLYAKAKKKALVAADKTAKAVSTFSFIAFIVFLLGAGAGGFGGATGSPEYTKIREARIKKD